jgi:hypothetical protein
MTVEEIYASYIRSLPINERLRLMALMAQDLAAQSATRASKPLRSILELRGLGKQLWAGVDAQAYVDSLRREWDQRADRG